MRDIDNDIRASLERLTDPHGNTAGTDELWGDLVDRRGKRRNRNRTLAALPVLLIAVLAVGIFATQGSDDARSDVAAGGADTAPTDVAEPTVTVSVNEMPSVEAFTSPLTPSDQGWLQHTVTLENKGAEPVHLNDFRSGTMMGDREVAVATDGCGYGSSGDQLVALGCNYDYWPVTIEPGSSHAFTITLWRDLTGMNPVGTSPYEWELPVHFQNTQFDHPDQTGTTATVTLTYENLTADVSSGEAEAGGLRVRNIQVFGNGPRAGGNERAVIVFNEPLPVDEVQYVADIASADPADGMVWTTQGPNSTHLCDSQHSVHDGAVGSVDLLAPASWFADADAHTVTELATIDNPAKFPICGPHNGFIQYSMWSPLSADPADVTVNVSSDRTTVTIEVASEGDVPLDPVAGQAVVADFLDRLRDDDVEGAAALWTGYPASQPNRPVSERVQYVELLAEYPPFARILASDTTTTFVTPSLDNENAQVVTILDARSPNSPPVAVAFLTELHDEDGDGRMWIQRLPPIDANATPELPNDGYVQPGERVVVPGLPVEGSVRGFVNGDEVPVEADLENETFTVIVPPEASGDIAVTFVVATPGEPVVRTFAAAVR